MTAYSLSIRRFWGKGERWKRKRERSEISSPLAPWEGLILRLDGIGLRSRDQCATAWKDENYRLYLGVQVEAL